MSSDRLYLGETCPALQLLLQRLVDDPKAQLEEMDFQDFEVAFSTSLEGDVLVLKVAYPFLMQVWPQGTEELLQHVWQGLPVRFALAGRDDEMKIAVEKAALGRLEASEAARCVERISSTRIWLLIGPLVSRLSWLRDAVRKGDEAAKKAPLNAQEARTAAIGQPPEACMLQLRNQESCAIVPKPDRIIVILSIHLDDETDVALGRAFCQEFAETNRKGNEFSLPCSFHEPKDKNMLSDLRGLAANVTPNVGFLSLTLTDQHVRGASEERLIALATPVMTFRNFFLFHLKHTKSFLHSRLRKRLDNWQQQIGKARRRRANQEKRRLISGKEFNPPTR